LCWTPRPCSLIDVEVTSALRRLAAAKRGDAQQSTQFLQYLADLPAERYPHLPLLSRVWELRHTLTAYDAVYVALAETLGATLFTCDDKLRTGRAAVVYFKLQ
jgi:predicted nucleic acid-binding protein